MRLIATAFVFLLAFTVGNNWSNSKDARAATQNEAAAATRARDLAQSLPAENGRDSLVQGIADYEASVANVEWPSLQRADGTAAFQAHVQASSAIAAQALQAINSGAEKTPQWSSLSSAIDTMISSGTDRVESVPGEAAPAVLAVIFTLGILNLAMTAIWQPTRIAANLALMGFMAAITALLLFVVVETSNPFVGDTSVQAVSVHR